MAGPRADGRALRGAAQAVRRCTDKQRAGQALDQHAVHRQPQCHAASHDRNRRGVRDGDGDGQQGTPRLPRIARGGGSDQRVHRDRLLCGGRGRAARVTARSGCVARHQTPMRQGRCRAVTLAVDRAPYRGRPIVNRKETPR